MAYLATEAYARSQAAAAAMASSSMAAATTRAVPFFSSSPSTIIATTARPSSSSSSQALVGRTAASVPSTSTPANNDAINRLIENYNRLMLTPSTDPRRINGSLAREIDRAAEEVILHHCIENAGDFFVSLERLRRELEEPFDPQIAAMAGRSFHAVLQEHQNRIVEKIARSLLILLPPAEDQVIDWHFIQNHLDPLSQKLANLYQPESSPLLVEKARHSIVDKMRELNHHPIVPLLRNNCCSIQLDLSGHSIAEAAIIHHLRCYNIVFNLGAIITSYLPRCRDQSFVDLCLSIGRLTQNAPLIARVRADRERVSKQGIVNAASQNASLHEHSEVDQLLAERERAIGNFAISADRGDFVDFETVLSGRNEVPQYSSTIQVWMRMRISPAVRDETRALLANRSYLAQVDRFIQFISVAEDPDCSIACCRLHAKFHDLGSRNPSRTEDQIIGNIQAALQRREISLDPIILRTRQLQASETLRRNAIISQILNHSSSLEFAPLMRSFSSALTQRRTLLLKLAPRSPAWTSTLPPLPPEPAPNDIIDCIGGGELFHEYVES